MKIYVDKIPKTCFECLFFVAGNANGTTGKMVLPNCCPHECPLSELPRRQGAPPRVSEDIKLDFERFILSVARTYYCMRTSYPKDSGRARDAIKIAVDVFEEEYIVTKRGGVTDD